MTLIDLLPALSCNRCLNITLIDNDDNQIVTFGASGYESLKTELIEMTVKKIKIISNNMIVIKIEQEDSNENNDQDVQEDATAK